MGEAEASSQGSTTESVTSQPTLEEAFAGSEGKSKLSSNFTRPKKLGKAAFSDGENELSGFSKKAKDPLKKRTEKKEEADASMESDVSFDPPPRELPKEEKVEAKKSQAEQEKTEVKTDEAQAQPKKYKVKVNGQDIEVDEAELLRGYQIRKASDQAFQEAARMRKEVEAKEARWKDKNQLGALFKEYGHDPQNLAETFLAQQIQFKLMTPEQQKIAILEAREAQRQQDAKALIAKQQMEKAQADEAKLASEISESIKKTLNTQKDLPKNPETIKKFIYQMRLRIMANQNLPDHLRENVTPELVMEDVKQMMRNEIQAGTSQMTPEQLIAFIGKEKLAEVRKYELSQIKNPIGKTGKIEVEQVKPQEKKKHYRTMEEWKDNQRRNGIRTY